MSAVLVVSALSAQVRGVEVARGQDADTGAGHGKARSMRSGRGSALRCGVLAEQSAKVAVLLTVCSLGEEVRIEDLPSEVADLVAEDLRDTTLDDSVARAFGTVILDVIEHVRFRHPLFDDGDDRQCERLVIALAYPDTTTGEHPGADVVRQKRVVFG